MKYDFQTRAPFAKPCPFCGSRRIATEKKDHFYDTKNRTFVFIECEDCGCQISGLDRASTETYNEAYHKALKAWNQRSGGATT